MPEATSEEPLRTFADSIEISPAEAKFLQQAIEEQTEVEFRFGKSSDRGFSPGVSAAVFKSLLRFLSSSSTYASCGESEYLKALASELSVTIIGQDQIKTFLKNESKFASGEYFSKAKVDKYDNLDYGYRISLAQEQTVVPTKNQLEAFTQSPKFYRYIKRYSYLTPDEAARIDLSLIKSGRESANTAIGSRVMMAPVTYELEVEFVGKNHKPGQMLSSEAKQSMYNAVYLMLKYIQDTEFPLSGTRKRSVLSDYVKSMWKGRFNPGDVERKPSRFFLGAMPHSLTLENIVPLDIASDAPNIRRPYPQDFTVTEKADGERYLLYVDSAGDAFLISRECQVRYTGNKSTKVHTLVDGEYVSSLNKYLAFDMLFNSGRDVRALPLLRHKKEGKTGSPGRMDILTAILSKKPFTGIDDRAVTVSSKRHFTEVDVIRKAGDLWRNRTDYKHDVDGVFFTSRADPYPRADRGSKSWPTCLKWKPRYLLSIDFQVFVRGEVKYVMNATAEGTEVVKPYRLVHLYVSHSVAGANMRTETRPFVPENNADKRSVAAYIARVDVDEKNRMLAKDPVTGQATEFKDRDIVEFAYNPANPVGYEWVPLRVRSDKTFPNAYRTALQVWMILHEANGLVADEKLFELLPDKMTDKIVREEFLRNKGAYYSIRESREDRKTSDIYNMRNFHGYVKQKIMVGASETYRHDHDCDTIVALLDLGCGKGGDYFRYREAAVERVFGVDPDKTGLNNLLHEFHDKYKRADKLPRVVSVFQADMTKLLSDGSAGATLQDSKALQDTYKRIGMGFFPIVSCQFAIHYAFKNDITMQTLMLNIYENLAVGGYFVGTTLDGQSMFDALRENESLDFGESDGVFATVKKLYSDDSLTLCGQAIDVTFKTISPDPRREYLVDFAGFANMMCEIFDICIISDEEAGVMHLPSGTGTFDALYAWGDDARSLKPLSPHEQKWSFMNRFFVMKKVGTGNGSRIQQIIKKVRSSSLS